MGRETVLRGHPKEGLHRPASQHVLTGALHMRIGGDRFAPSVPSTKAEPGRRWNLARGAQCHVWGHPCRDVPYTPNHHLHAKNTESQRAWTSEEAGWPGPGGRDRGRLGRQQQTQLALEIDWDLGRTAQHGWSWKAGKDAKRVHAFMCDVCVCPKPLTDRR